MDEGCISGKIRDGEIGKLSALTECSMCGDVGFSSELFQCRKCLYRMQHRYCSNRYPRLGPDDQICNWCDIDVNNRASPKDFKTRHRSKAKTPEIESRGYKEALTYLLKVAKSAADGKLPPAKPVHSKVMDDNAATISKALQTPKQQQCRLNVKNRLTFAKKWKPLKRRKLQLASTTSKGFTERRYKLLSDILC